jgi:long-chain fatty acid transport protein
LQSRLKVESSDRGGLIESHYGASFKSKQWFERFRFKTADELGRSRTESLKLEYPTIVSVGTAYSGFENVLLAADLRYFGYGDAAGLGQSGFNPDGSVAGLGWDDILVLAMGAQLCLTDRAYLRFGYSFNENPIRDSQTSANVASPVITQHYVSVGASYHVRPHWVLSLAYAHGFKNRTSGPIVTPLGPVPGSLVSSEVSLDLLTVGMTVRH